MTGDVTGDLMSDGAPGRGLTLPALDDRPGPARRISAAHAGRLVGGALAASSPARPVPNLARRVAFAATMTLALGGAASAAFVVARQYTASPAAAPRAASARSLGAPPAAAVVAPPPVLAEAPAPVAALQRQPRARAGRPAIPAVDHLREANQLRRQGRWREAERAYRQVAAAAPRSDDAYAATVAAASLCLEHLDDPRGARSLYAGVLLARPAGALAEEARWGLAEAQRRLGDRAGEAQALRGFVAHHPSALQRTRAESRLDALGP